MKKKESYLSIAGISQIGMRGEQQDAMWFCGMTDENVGYAEANIPESMTALAIVADGMGGLESGRAISRLVTAGMRDAFFAPDKPAAPVAFLQNALWKVNQNVNMFLDGKNPGGSTVIASCITDRKLYYFSVGDSRIYFYRKKSMCQLNIEHNYAADLDEYVRRGVISAQEAMTNVQRGALTSYVGMGDIKKVDGNEVPIALEEGDVILMMTDGVYRALSPEEMLGCVRKGRVTDIVRLIAQGVAAKNKPKQDNYTVVAIGVGTHG